VYFIKYNYFNIIEMCNKCAIDLIFILNNIKLKLILRLIIGLNTNL